MAGAETKAWRKQSVNAKISAKTAAYRGSLLAYPRIENLGGGSQAMSAAGSWRLSLKVKIRRSWRINESNEYSSIVVMKW